MRHLLALLGSLGAHGIVLAAILFSVKQVNETPQATAVKTVAFDLGMMAVEAPAPTPNLPQNQPTQAQTTVTEPEPEPIIEPVIVPKPVVKTKLPKKIKKKEKSKPKKKTKKKESQKKSQKKVKQTVKPKSQRQTTKKKISTTTALKTASVTKTGVGTATASQVKSQSQKNTNQGGKGSSNKRSSANANAYRAALTAAIKRIAKRNYPRTARRMRKQGTVRVQFNLARDGRISGVSVVGSSGHGSLDRAAVKALKRLGKYNPPPKGVQSVLIVPIEFKLK